MCMASSDGVRPAAGPADSLQMALGLATAAAAVVDGDGIVTAWTPGAERLLGYRPADVVGSPARRLLVTGGQRPGTAGEGAEGGRGGPGTVPPRQAGSDRHARSTTASEQSASGQGYWSGIKD